MRAKSFTSKKTEIGKYFIDKAKSCPNFCVFYMCLFIDLLVVWVSRHINLCRLFIAKSIFIHVNCSISNNSV